MKTIFSTLAITIFFYAANAQTFVTKRDVSEKLLKSYNDAATLMLRKNYENSIKTIDKVIKTVPNFIDAYALKAEIYWQLKDYPNSIIQSKKAIDLDSSHARLQFLAIVESYFEMAEYEKAKPYITTFLKFNNILYNYRLKAEKYAQICDFGIEAVKHPVPFNPINLGDSVNGSFSEYLPAITADEQTLVFTVNTKSEGRFNEDFFETNKVNGIWSKAKNIGKPINTKFNEGAQTISPDGKYMFFTVCNAKDGLGSCDIYFSKKIGNHWSPPINMGAPINSKYWESQPSISADGKSLYFASNRKGGSGKKDIWVSHLTNTGAFGKPINLGTAINTSGEEQCPFIHPDGQTLYFSSDGHIGLGDADIFYSRINEKGIWAKPINLGYPINTINNENSMIVSSNGQRAYFSSDREDTRGQLDLYYFNLYKEAKPQEVTYVKGIVTDAESGLTLSSDIELIDIETGEIITSTTSDEENGFYLVCLLSGKDYALNINKKSYLFDSENFSLKDRNHKEPYIMDIQLHRICVGCKVTLNNIFFDIESYELKPTSKAELDKLVAFLNRYPTTKIRINGHTDNIGKADYNLELSEKRAHSVRDYLVQNGINESRLSYKGFGANKAIASNDTKEGRAQNRRTEFEIISK